MSFPVVIADSGVPVVAVESGAPAAIVAQNGSGLPITLTATNGIPLIIDGMPEPDPEQEE